MNKALYPQASAELARKRRRSASGPTEAFKAFGDSVFAVGTVPRKTRQLIAVAVAYVTQCPYCIHGHTKRAERHAARPRQKLMRPLSGTSLLLLAALVLTACDGGQTTDTAHNGEQTFASESYGIAITYPSDFHAQPDFSGSYLQNGSWETYAGPDSKGQAIVALVLAGSNAVTDAELRIGASRNKQAVAACTQPPAAVRSASPGHATLDGVRFVTWKAADAAMSHYLKVRSYRAVHDGTCYAIDLLVYGTNPKVYDPPRTPPFTQKEAFARLEAALGGFRFTR